MTWKPIDFQGIISLDKSLIEELYQYLDDKEALSSHKIIYALQSLSDDSGAPVLVPGQTPAMRLKLSDAVESIGKKIRQTMVSRYNLPEPDEWRKIAEAANGAFWEYLEVLEECVTELFQQLDQIGVEEWRIEMAHVVDAMKEMLIHRIDDLNWAIRRIEAQLWELRWVIEKQRGRWVAPRKAFFFWQTMLDRLLRTNLEKCRKYLGFRYQKFSDRYGRYIEIHTKIELALEKFNTYKAFETLDWENKEKFKKIHNFVKLWELNERAKSLPSREPIRALRSLISAEKALALFREYYQVLLGALFEQSRNVKNHPNEVRDIGYVNRILELIASYRAELHTLRAIITKYRDFLLRTDPNPYVRSRWGFPEWVVGPEPTHTKQMLSLHYEVENLDSLFESLRQALERKPVMEETGISEVDKDIQIILHEMNQPLMSRGVMKMRLERLLILLQQLDELCSSSQSVVNYVGQVLSKALRADWKYHVMFEIPAFHQIYAIHYGILKPIEDRQHDNRMHKFKRLIQQILQWVKNNDSPRHSHEIELDMNDIKGYLQDFFGQVQRLSAGNQEELKAASQQLLEYRYLFGNFFHQLRETKPEERIIRNQFLFVDQYFESVENRLHELVP